MDKRVPKAERALIQDLEAQAKEIRNQFGEQLRAFEQRTDVQAALLLELQDFFKRKAEVEADYGRALDKLARQLGARARSERGRRDAWAQHSMHALWEQLVAETRDEARMHTSLADVYSSHAATQLSHRADGLHRVARRCRELGTAAHEEIARVLTELITSMKTYHLCYSECSAVETKFRAVEAIRAKFEEAHPEKVANSRKHRMIEKDYNKRHLKYTEYKLRALRARNEYLLCVDAANAALHQYFADDVSDLLDCSDLGLQHWLANLVSVLVGARKTVCQHDMDALAELSGLCDNFDSRLDKRRFLEAQHVLFSLPKRFDFRPAGDDSMKQVSAQHSVQDDLVQRLWQIQKRLADLRAEHDEVWKTLVTTEKRVLDLQTQPPVDLDDVFQEPAADAKPKSCREPDLQLQKRKQELSELEDFYIEKFHQYLLHANLMKRLQARNEALRKALDARPTQSSDSGEGSHPSASAQASSAAREDRVVPTRKRSAVVVGSKRPGSLAVTHTGAKDRRSSSADEPATPATPDDALAMEAELALGTRPPELPPKPRKRVVAGTRSGGGRAKLFGGTVDEYAEATGEPVPLLIISCVRMLAAFGLHHQGVFRVSGSQLEINRFKESFEKGIDPLVSGAVDAADVNSVAGVLKLYFRELREPLFPVYMFSQFIECAKMTDRVAFLHEITSLVGCLSTSVVVVLRYLFAFLNHLAEYSDENMMEPYNLAICFGPTLVPIPDDKDQVFYHNYVNELVKNMIIYHEHIFPRHLPGPVYERFPLHVNAEHDGVDDIECEPSPGTGLLSASELDEPIGHRTTSCSSAAGRSADNQLQQQSPAVMTRSMAAADMSPMLTKSLVLNTAAVLTDETDKGLQCVQASPSKATAINSDRSMTSMARARLNPVELPPAAPVPNKPPMCISSSGTPGLLKLRPYTSVEGGGYYALHRTHRKLASEPPPGCYDEDFDDVDDEDETLCCCDRETTPHRQHPLQQQQQPHAAAHVRRESKDSAHLTVAVGEADGRLSAASLGVASSCAPAVSPASLREIQTELKAVLNSLEMFNMSQQPASPPPGHNNNVDSGDYGKCDVVAGGEVTGAPGGILHGLGPAPDLVQNLPACRASPQKSVDSSTCSVTHTPNSVSGHGSLTSKGPLMRQPQPPPPAVKPKPNLSGPRTSMGSGATVAPVASCKPVPLVESPGGGASTRRLLQHQHAAIDRVLLAKDGSRLSPVLTVMEENL